MMKQFFWLFFIGGLFFKLSASDVVIQKVPPAWFEQQTKSIETYMGTSVHVISKEGKLLINNTVIKSAPQFVLTQPIPWKFEITLNQPDSSTVYNLNHHTNWYIRQTGSKAWRKIEAEHIDIAAGKSYDLRIDYSGQSPSFSIHNPVIPLPFNGMTTPLFTVPALRTRLLSTEIKNGNNLVVRYQTSQTLSRKSTKELIEINGRIIPKIYKRFHSDTLILTIPLSPEMLAENSTSAHIRIFSDNNLIVNQTLAGLPVSFTYQAPQVLKNNIPYSFLAFHFVPDTQYPALTLNPKRQHQSFKRIKQLGYNTIITDLDNLSPMLLFNAWKNGMNVIAQISNPENASTILKEAWLVHAPNLMLAFPGEQNDLQKFRFFSWIQVPVKDASWEMPRITSMPPLYNISSFSEPTIAKLLNELKQYGGLICHNGYYIPEVHELPNPLDIKKKMTLFINQIKQTYPVKLSGCFNSLTSFGVWYPVCSWHTTQFTNYPYALLPDGKSLSRDADYFITLMQSPIPLQYELPAQQSGNDALFIGIGLVNFFLFLIYFIRLRSFSYYLTRSIKNSHGFFIDLHEKIAVPWSESLMLLLFSSVGFGVSLGAYFYFYKNYLVLGHWLNIVFVNPDITTFVLQWLQKPLQLIISLAALYILYITILGLSLRFVAYIFKVKIRLRYALALSIWAHAWAFLFAMGGFVAYRSFLLFGINSLFWVFVFLVFTMGYFRFNKGIFLSVALKKHQIYLISLFMLGILFFILYSGGYPFGEMLHQFNELIQY